jgi:hypothetical protein
MAGDVAWWRTCTGVLDGEEPLLVCEVDNMVTIACMTDFKVRRDFLSGGELTVAIEEYNSVGHSYSACLQRDLISPQSLVRTDRDIVDDLASERFRTLLDAVLFLYTRAFAAAKQRHEEATDARLYPNLPSSNDNVSSLFLPGSPLYAILASNSDASNAHIRSAVVLYLNLLILEAESDAATLYENLRTSQMLNAVVLSGKGTLHALLWALMVDEGPMTAEQRARVDLIGRCLFVRKHLSRYVRILCDAAFMSFLVADKYGLEGLLTPEHFEARAWEDLQNSRICNSGTLQQAGV